MDVLVAYLLGILTAIYPQRIERENEKCKTGQEGRKPQPPAYPERISAEINLSPTEAKRYYSEEDKTYRLQRRIFWVNVITFLALAAYTGFTYRILCSMKEANKLTRDMFAASQVAGFDCQVQVQGPGPPAYLEVRCENDGVVPARNIIADYTYTRKDKSGEVLQSTPRHVERIFIARNKALDRLFYAGVNLGELPTLPQDYRMEVVIGYENGMGRVTQPYCGMMIVNPKNRGTGWTDCDNGPELAKHRR